MVLEKSYIDKILKQIFKTTHLEHFDIITDEFASGRKKYAGEIFFVRTKNTVNNERLNLCIKRAHADEHIRKVLPIRDFYLNENHFYEHIWPSFKTFQEGCDTVALPFDKIPKCYLIESDEDEETIVIEKLSHFQTNDAINVLSKDKLSLIFKEYGKFHALSFAYKEKRSEEYHRLASRLKDNYQHYRNIKVYADIMNRSHDLCNSLLIPGIDDDVIRKYGKYVTNAMDVYCESSRYLGSKSVITHGDCSITNYMFKYDEKGDVEDMRFIDFQFSRIGTPVYDLASCIYACSAQENYSNLEYFLKLYYQSLCETLTVFDCDHQKLYTFVDLKNDWKIYAKFGFAYAVVVIRNLLVEDEVVTNTFQTAEVRSMGNNNMKFYETELKDRLLGLVRHMANNDFL